MTRRIVFVLVAAVFAVAGCGKGSGSAQAGLPGQDSVQPGRPVNPAYKMFPLAWESAVPGSAKWSQFVYNLVLTQAPSLMNGSSDVQDFCSNYPQLSSEQKANFWAYLISEIANYESGFNPSNRFVETALGKDLVTGQTVVSEGLMQLSYQDTLNYPFCGFNWRQDSSLSSTDPGKTILDPYTNLACGTLILNTQVRNQGRIEASAAVYWSTLNAGSSRNKLSEIKAATQSLPFCALK